MPYIQVIDEAEADHTLRAAYARVKGDRGKTSNILKIHSLLPQTMTGHLDFYMTVMFAKGALDRRQRELVATVVSAANRCDYCVQHHAEALRTYVKERGTVDQILHDYAQAPLDTRDRALCDFAIKLTRVPDQMRESDVLTLRQAGWDDRAVLHLALVVGYFNFVNRMALGLGVTLSGEDVVGYDY